VTPADQAHLQVLKLLSEEPELSQRQLAERLGVSVGKTNYLIKSLVEKGHVKVQNFRQTPNKLKYAYLLTPEGLYTKLQLTRNYLARKEQEYNALKSEIAAIRAELAIDDCSQ
jgi:EPS-associated MarR family transcriptional regulator